jgi:hypothetical protein
MTARKKHVTNRVEHRASRSGTCRVSGGDSSTIAHRVPVLVVLNKHIMCGAQTSERQSMHSHSSVWMLLASECVSRRSAQLHQFC